MVTKPPARHGIVAVVLLTAALPAVAAAAAPPAAVSDRYLLDDTDFVLVINVKQIRASALWTRELQPQIGTLLKEWDVSPWIREIGPQVLRDADSVVVVHGQSCYSGIPQILIEGRFTPEKVQAWVNQTRKQNLARLEAVMIEGVPGYQVTGLPEYTIPGCWLGGEVLSVAMLDAHTLVMAPQQPLVAQMIAKAAGEKKTSLRIPAMRQLLGQMDAQASVEFAAVREMVIRTERTVTGIIPGTGNPMIGLKYFRLGDSGIESLCGTFSVRETLRARVKFVARDADTARGIARQATESRDRVKKELQGLGANQGKLGPVLKSLDGIKVSANGPSVLIEGEAVPGVVERWARLSLLRIAQQRAKERAQPPVP